MDIEDPGIENEKSVEVIKHWEESHSRTVMNYDASIEDIENKISVRKKVKKAGDAELEERRILECRWS